MFEEKKYFSKITTLKYFFKSNGTLVKAFTKTKTMNIISHAIDKIYLYFTLLHFPH